MRNKNSTGVVPPTRETSRMSSPPPPSSSAHDQQELERTPSQLVSLPHHHLHHHEPGIETEIEAVPGPEAIRCAERDVHKLQKLLHHTCAQALTVARGLSYCTSTRAAAQLWPAQRETEEQEKKINELQVKLKAAYAEVASQGRLVANAKQKSLECERREEDTRARLELAERDGAALRELFEKHLREKEEVLKDHADLRAKYAKLIDKNGRVEGKDTEYKRRLALAERKEDEEGDRANTLEIQKIPTPEAHYNLTDSERADGWNPRKRPLEGGSPRTKKRQERLFKEDIDEFLISDQEDQEDQEACKQEGSRSIGSSSDTNENKGKDDLDEKVLTPPDFWHIQVTPPFL